MDFSGIRFGAQIDAAARAHGIDPALLAAVAAQETGGPGSRSGNNIVGDGGHGRGVFQIDDRSWAFARTPAAMDPAQNADMAASILHDDLARYGGNVRMALSAYNSGSPTAAGTATSWPDGTTLGYADSVLRHYDALAGEPQATAGGGDSQAIADNRELSGDVNSLANVGAAQPASIASAAFQPAMPQTPQTNHNGAQSDAASKVGSEADSALGDLVDGGDVFGDDD